MQTFTSGLRESRFYHHELLLSTQSVARLKTRGDAHKKFTFHRTEKITNVFFWSISRGTGTGNLEFSVFPYVLGTLTFYVILPCTGNFEFSQFPRCCGLSIFTIFCSVLDTLSFAHFPLCWGRCVFTIFCPVLHTFSFSGFSLYCGL